MKKILNRNNLEVVMDNHDRDLIQYALDFLLSNIAEDTMDDLNMSESELEKHLLHLKQRIVKRGHVPFWNKTV